MHPLCVFINEYIPISGKDEEVIEACLERTTYAAHDHILKQGQRCSHLYFLETGLLRFHYDREGDDITKFFTVAPYLFTSQKSFTDHKPAAESIQTLEDSHVWRMSYADAHRLLALPVWNEFVRKLIQEVQFYTENLLLEMQTETAEARYRKMLETQPDLVQRIPVKYLASYFGIAPQSLSRIRKQMLAKKEKL